MTLRTHPNLQIITYQNNIKNGWLLPIYNIHDSFITRLEAPEQVYLTAIDGYAIKGPHLHFKRRGLFTCVYGNIRIIARVNNKYEIYYSGDDHNYQTIEVPRGIPVALQNLENKTALVLNMPCPAWTPEMNDQNKVEFDDFNFQL